MTTAGLQSQLDTLLSGVSEVLPADGLEAKLKKSLATGEPLTVKLGVDPTAPDLHLGHAVPLRKLRQFQELGHQVVLIIGDFTAMIGDPSGRSKTRPHLSAEDVRQNADTYTNQAFKILDREKTRLVYNSEWLSPLNMADILELVSRFTVAGLLVRDDFQKRYRAEQPIGLHEFMYPVMQAYDSVVLSADVELGGTDQRFNLLAGRELQEKLGKEPQICIMLPLLVGTDGERKMSKSYGNHIGLSFEPWDMFGKVMSIPDALMSSYFRLATLVPESEVAALEADLASGAAHPAKVKRRLATEILSIYYGKQAASAAEAEFDARFVPGKKTAEAEQVATLDPEECPEGRIWPPRLLKLTGMVTSNSEARRLIGQGGVRINGAKLEDADSDMAISEGDIIEVGKRPRVRIELKR